MTNPLARRLERLEADATIISFTIETLVLASFGVAWAEEIMTRVESDYRSGRLTGRAFLLIDSILNHQSSIQ